MAGRPSTGPRPNQKEKGMAEADASLSPRALISEQWHPIPNPHPTPEAIFEANVN